VEVDGESALGVAASAHAETSAVKTSDRARRHALLIVFLGSSPSLRSPTKQPTVRAEPELSDVFMQQRGQLRWTRNSEVIDPDGRTG